MARILLTWELGGGLGHLVNLKPFAVRLSERSHQVFAALKDVTRADHVLKEANVSYLQAPIMPRRLPGYVDRAHTFAHILYNSGFGDPDVLSKLTEAWKHIYDYVQPDVIVFDHSPTALLASRGRNVKRCYIGTGFFVPPPVYPLPNLRREPPVDPETLRQDEDRIVQQINRLMDQWNEPHLRGISDLFAQLDRNFLATFQELDHYPQRQNGEYIGAWPQGVGQAPQWPQGNGKRIFAYLKPFPALPQLLTMLGELGHPTLAYIDGADAASLRRFAAPNIRFECQPLELKSVGAQCDVAILNGNHGTTVGMLLAGKPTLHIPIHMEQAVFADGIRRLGAGLRASSDKPDEIRRGLKELLTSDRFREASQAFAARYADDDSERQERVMIREVESLLPATAEMEGHSLHRPVTVDPHTLVHHKRFDVMAKYLYARHRAWGIRSNWGKHLYLTHMHVFNNFVEIEPPKNGPDAFLEAFDDVLDSVASNGFDGKTSVVEADEDNVLHNGAHRLAACLAHEKQIVCQLRITPATEFSALWFRQRTDHVATGLPMSCGDPMAVEFARLKKECRVVLINTATRFDEGALLRCLRAFGNVVYAKRLDLDCHALRRLQSFMESRKLLQQGENGSVGLLPETSSANGCQVRVRAFLFEWMDDEDNSAELLRHLRTIEPDSGVTMAATRDHAPSVELAESLFNENGVQWIRSMRQQPDASLNDRLTELEMALAEHGIDRRNVLLHGDTVSSVLGRQECNRLDVLVTSVVDSLPSIKSVSFHRRMVSDPQMEVDELIANPRCQFHYRGLNFLAAAVRS